MHHEQDMRHMGGLRKKIPITFATLSCAWVAIAGVPPFSGYHSKDAILLAAHHHAPWMYWVGTITAGITAFYVSRAMFMTFFGEFRGHGHPHESPVSMWAPLAVLAALSLGGGYFDIPHFLEPVFPVEHGAHDMTLVAISVGAGLLGIAIAWLLYVAKPGMADSIANGLGGVYRLVYNKYFVDELYDATIVRPLVKGSRQGLWQFGDAWFIDGMVNGVGAFSRATGGVLKHLQSGNIRSYAAWVVVGSVAVLVAAGVLGAAGGWQGGAR
jgi:NADH-quinone oxidoreductase subunit L